MTEVEPMDEIDILMALGTRLSDVMDLMEKHYPEDSEYRGPVAAAVVGAWLAINFSLDALVDEGNSKRK